MKRLGTVLGITCLLAVLTSTGCVAPSSPPAPATKTVTQTVTATPPPVTLPPVTVTQTVPAPTVTVTVTPTPTIVTSSTPKPNQSLPPASPPTIISTPTPVSSPSPTATGTVQLTPAPQSTLMVSRSYKWTYGNKQWTWDLQFSQALYDFYKSLPRSPTRNYSVYVTHPLDDNHINQLATKINDLAKQQGYSDFERVSYAAAFVQSLPYTVDSVTTKYDEYPRYPIETLVDNGGDCEDTSILMASLLKAMGYGSVLLIFPSTAGNPGHAAVGVLGGQGIYGTYWEYKGGKYYYLETTGTGWRVGEIPNQYKGTSANVYDMVPVPILTDSWSAKQVGAWASVQVTVSNLGSAPAAGVSVYAGFDAGNNMIWNRQTSSSFQVGIDEKVTVTLNLEIPHGKHTRIIVETVSGGYAITRTYSDWFDT